MTILADLEQRIKDRLGDFPFFQADEFCSKPLVEAPTDGPPHAPGFWHWVGGEWVAVPTKEALPQFNGAVLDFEAKEVSPGVWEPTCCAIYNDCGGPVGDLDFLGATKVADNTSYDAGDPWWFWWALPLRLGMPWPRDAYVIGHNSIAYDRRYLSGEYEDPHPDHVLRAHLDTMGLAMVIGGIAGDDDDRAANREGAIRKMWKKFQREVESGKGVPQWYSQTHSLGLDYLVEKFLGVKLEKAIRRQWVEDPTSVQPTTLATYCMADTYWTAMLFQKLWPIVRSQFIPSLVTWHGMRRCADQRFFLKDWEGFLSQSEAEYQAALADLQGLQERAIAGAIANPNGLPVLDWGVYVKGANKGKYKWIASISTPFGSTEAAYCCKLRWDGEPIEIRKLGVGQPRWWANGEPLPHPEGEGKNLGNPFCQDYRQHVETGRLTSETLSREDLLKVFDLMESIGQWQSYRSRYQTLYRQPTQWEGITCSVAGLNPTGTISRRSTSDIWTVLPKPGSGKIGSTVMEHIVAPPGFTFVSADFVSQESRIATAILTDCRNGRHNSTPWSEAVLSGDKRLGTDVHSQTSKALGVSRDDGKTVNFKIQYGGGIASTAQQLALIKGIPLPEATEQAAKFLHSLKGAGGIAEQTFRNLQFLAGTTDLRTYLLGVKQPATINPRWLPNPRDFVMLRGNHPIQSGGVDEKHALISFIDVILAGQGIAESAWFSNEIHDQVVYLAKVEVAEQVAKVFDFAVAKLMQMSYEQGAAFWDAIDPLPSGPRPILTAPPQWCKFERVTIADTLAGCK